MDKQLSSFKSIMQYIPDRKDLTEYLTHSQSRFAGYIPIVRAEKEILFSVDGSVGTELVSKVGDRGRVEYSQKLGAFGYSGVTQAGDCGRPLVLAAPTLQAKFVAIHSRGSNSISLGQVITRDYIKDLTTKKESDVEESDAHSAERHDDLYYFDEETDLQRDGVLNIPVIGKTKHRVYIPKETKEYRTPFPVEAEHEPTIKHKGDPRNPNRVDVLREGLARYTEPVVTDDISWEVDNAAEEIGNYLGNLLKSADKPTRVLTLTESINGAFKEEFPAVKPLDRSGSAGYPLVQKNPGRPNKGSYLEQRKEGGPWYFKKDRQAESVVHRVNHIVQRARQGITCDEPFIAYSKDEPVKMKKITTPKTRVFFGGSFAYFLAYRRYFSAALWRIQEVMEEVPIKIGMNVRGVHWTRFIMSMLKVGPEGFASDMANWDGCVPIEFLRAACKVLNIAYRLSDPNWKEEDDVAREAIHRNIEGALIIIENDVVRLDHAMTSGFPGTAMENSIINWILFYCVFRRIMIKAKKNCSFTKFLQLLALGVFGDDNVVAVSPLISQFFHFNTFKVEAKKFGFEVTDAAKAGGEQPNLQPVVELEFLKRSTRRQGNYFYALLDKSSINKMLCWHKSSPSYIFEGEWRQFNDAPELVAILREVAYEHTPYGEQAYDDFVEKAMQWCQTHKLLMSFPSYVEAFCASGYSGH